MATWQEDKLQELKFIDNDRTMFLKVSNWANELGFNYCTVVMRAPLPISSPKTYAVSNYPEAWQEAYQRNNYLTIDPVVQHGLRSQEMLVWSDEVFAGTPDLRRTTQTAGIRFGLSQPTRGNLGAIGLLSLARSDQAVTPAELEEKKFKLVWLAQIAHQGMSKHLASDLMPAPVPQLTERELSVLRWTAEGKTSEKIADILQISERTVNFHINNAVAKLGTTNRTSAAVQAALLGLL